jgi:hypothetical protein
MIEITQAEEYLSVAGATMPPEVSDKDWVLVLASLYRGGFVVGLDWDSPSGQIMLDLIGGVWPGYVEWRDENGIDPDTFRWPEA